MGSGSSPISASVGASTWIFPDRVRTFNDRGDFFARAVVTEDVRPGIAVSYGVRWASRSERGRTVNDTTAQRLSDVGGGATFYDNAVEVEAVAVN